MKVVQLILQIGAIGTAVITICVVVKRVIKFFKNILAFIHNMTTNVATLLRHDEAQYKAILRLTITADHMPISERLLAGKEYVEELHGNGEVKAIYNELKEKCEHINDE